MINSTPPPPKMSGLFKISLGMSSKLVVGEYERFIVYFCSVYIGATPRLCPSGNFTPSVDYYLYGTIVIHCYRLKMVRGDCGGRSIGGTDGFVSIHILVYRFISILVILIYLH